MRIGCVLTSLLDMHNTAYLWSRSLRKHNYQVPPFQHPPSSTSLHGPWLLHHYCTTFFSVPCWEIPPKPHRNGCIRHSILHRYYYSYDRQQHKPPKSNWSFDILLYHFLILVCADSFTVYDIPQCCWPNKENDGYCMQLHRLGYW